MGEPAVSDKIAVEFVRFVLQQNPAAGDFAAIYDAMTRAASARSFRNLGYAELTRLGVSFSLLNTTNLERLVNAARSGDA